MARRKKTEPEVIEEPVPDAEVPEEPIETIEDEPTPVEDDTGDSKPIEDTTPIEEPKVAQDTVTDVPVRRRPERPPREDREARINRARDDARTIRQMDIKDEWKEKLIESEMQSFADMPDGQAREVILVQYRDKEGDALENALITHSRLRLTEAWEFYQENIPGAKQSKFLDTFIGMAKIGRTSYKKVQTIRLE